MQSSIGLGRLVVFEGPDGVGKSTLSEKLANELRNSGVSCEHFSFPGRDEGTLGKLVYEVHHNPASHSVSNIVEASQQLLHIAAHIDSIETRIEPALREGRWVILDRFWWSTWVYGKQGAVDEKILEAMIEVERLRWADIRPDVVFLIERNSGAVRADTPSTTLASLYRELFEIEKTKYSTHLLRNDGPVEEALNLIHVALRNLVEST